MIFLKIFISHFLSFFRSFVCSFFLSFFLSFLSLTSFFDFIHSCLQFSLWLFSLFGFVLYLITFIPSLFPFFTPSLLHSLLPNFFSSLIFFPSLLLSLATFLFLYSFLIFYLPSISPPLPHFLPISYISFDF